MAKHIQYFLSYLCLIIVVLVVSSCSIKKKKDSSFISNFSTKFNILHNSNLLLQDARKITEEGNIANYQQIVTVFKDPTVSSIQQNKSILDSVIGKANRIINEKHDSKYVDQAFLLKGKAFYLQGDYFNANEFFDYIQKNAEDNPSIQEEALLWRIRSLLQLGSISEAKKVLEDLNTHNGETKRSKHLIELSFATQANYHLNQNRKNEAIAFLAQAVESSKNKKDRLHWQYLLGQLHFEKGENESAYSNFSKVAKSNESYEMIFHANLYRIEILNKDNPDINNRVKLLSKLLRDGKNKNYKGQIHQRIGDTYLIDQQLEKAIQHYELANRNTVNNSFQQSLNYQKLADLYFDQGDYTKSSLYYDSTVLVLPKENPAYEQLSRKQSHLESLVKQLTTISYQDSLIQFALMSPEEREATIGQMIAKRQEANSSNSTKGKRNQQSASTVNNFIFENPSNESGSFYFSSSAAISQGYSDFKKRWGNRTNDSHWRYSNQPSTIASSEIEVAQLNNETENLENNTYNLRERYLQDLPDTPDKLILAEKTIKNAYLALAESYKNDLQDDENAITTYETYLNRFPNDENTPVLYFHLYRLYTDKSPESSSLYKEKLIKEYPNSTYTYVLNDPDYYKKQQDILQKFNEQYSAVYNLFSTQKYKELIQQANEIMQNNDFSSLESNIAQLSYLRAIAIGRTSNINDFQTSLLTLVDDYPQEEVVVPVAKQHLAYIESNEALFKNKAIALDDINLDRESFEKEFALTPWPELSYSKEYKTPVIRRNYELEQSQVSLTTKQGLQETAVLSNKNIKIGELTNIGHDNSYRDLKLFPDTANYLFVINIMHGSINLSPSRFGIGQFNRGQYSAKEITHQLKNIADENQLVYIGSFSSYDEVKEYENRIMPLLSDIMKIPAAIYNSFIVTEAVFNTFANSDQIDEYNSFYETQK